MIQSVCQTIFFFNVFSDNQKEELFVYISDNSSSKHLDQIHFLEASWRTIKLSELSAGQSMEQQHRF